MPRGDKSAYSDKQKRKAAKIETGYRKRGVKKKEAESRAWATVNKESGGGNKSGSGRGVKDTKVSAKKGGTIGGRASASRSTAAKSKSAKKAAATRKRRSTTKKTTAHKSTARRTTARKSVRKTSRKAARATKAKRSTARKRA